MARLGVADLPLHGGKAPKWLFKRMVLLSEAIIEVITNEYGSNEFLKRLSDPFWFQAFSCVLGFDWHSSGTTTVTCGALKEAIKPEIHGFAIAGGKGKESKKTLEQIEYQSEFFNLSDSIVEDFKYSSRMVAKVDNSAIQDGHSLYHHVFLFSEDGLWGVIQQGLNGETKYARRYHWFSKSFENFLCEPHKAILGKKDDGKILDMTSVNSQSNQKVCVDLVRDNPSHLIRDWNLLHENDSQRTLDFWIGNPKKIMSCKNLYMPRSINWNKMREIYDFQPRDFEELISIKGVGSSTIRALALISDLVYGDSPSWEDPVKYSFAVGGKDGVPFPVDRRAMDESIDIMFNGLRDAKIGNNEKLKAIKRLKFLCGSIKDN